METAGDSGTALVQGSSLSGSVLVEIPFDVGLSVGKLKDAMRPILTTGQDAKLMLLLDGSDPNDAETLTDIGVKAGEVVTFTVVIYDPQAVVMMEITALHRQGIEKSRQEADEQRRLRRQKRLQLLAERRQQVESEYAKRHEIVPAGPTLMLANEPANLVSQVPQGTFEAQSSLPMLANEAANAAEPLKKDWRSAADEILAAYSDFFDHISFRKGWKTPPFSKADSKSAFATAACVVARARVEILDVRDPGFKLRQVDGSARDWMHSPDLGQVLQKDPRQFIAGLVHATFQDAKGYVEGLAESEVNGFLANYS